MHYTLRPWDISDLGNLVKYANNKKIADNLTDKFPHPYTEENGRSFIEFASDIQNHRIFAIAIDGNACGGIGLHPQSDVYRKNAELGYWLAEPFWGNGIVTAAIKEIVNWGFNNMEIDRVFARPYGRNKASQRVLEKAGFKLEAKFEKTLWKNEQYEDELVYAVRRNSIR